MGLFNWPFQGGTSFWDTFCYLRFVSVMLSCLFIAAFWSPARKGLASLLSCMLCFLVFVTFPCGVLGQVWYLIVLFPDLCRLSYFVHMRLYQNSMCWPYKYVKIILGMCWCLVFVVTHLTLCCKTLITSDPRQSSYIRTGRSEQTVYTIHHKQTGFLLQTLQHFSRSSGVRVFRLYMV